MLSLIQISSVCLVILHPHRYTSVPEAGDWVLTEAYSAGAAQGKDREAAQEGQGFPSKEVCGQGIKAVSEQQSGVEGIEHQHGLQSPA